MRPARWRIPWAAALVAGAGAGIALLFVGLAGAGGAGSAGWLVWAVAALLAAAAMGFAVGARLAAQLNSLRRRVLARARSAGEQPLPTSRLVEVQELAQSADLLASGFTRRTRRLEQQSAQLTTLVESVSDGLLRIGPAGHITFLNPAARALLSLPESARGQPIAVLVRSGELRQLIEGALQGERVEGAEVTLGDRRILVSAQPLDPAVGHASAAGGAVVALSDLTALRRLEGVRRDFVANVSHELKTPLTSIRGYAETLLADDAPPDLQRQFLEVIHRNAARLQRIVDELLDLSVIESGGWRPAMQELNPAELVRDAWASCRDLAAERHIDFRAPSTDLRVRADPSALRQVIGNLFDNAIRHTPEGGWVQVRVAGVPRQPTPGAEAGGPARLVAIEVIDNGTGIPREALPRVFERFYRVDPARSRAAGGTGLGLAIVKHMVESMGGEVEAESELGKGTTIRLTLPAA